MGKRKKEERKRMIQELERERKKREIKLHKNGKDSYS